DTKTTVVPPFWRFLKALWLKNSLNMVYFPNSKLTPLTRRYVPTSGKPSSGPLRPRTEALSWLKAGMA
ncbi:hypothetical protein BTT21_24160, partial [Salmonella enterica subsp. enterica serovar Schwarzengrund]|nr:hypothetical protein [Salmonella enterica subsp. enterica serovar Schwarzengrund]